MYSLVNRSSPARASWSLPIRLADFHFDLPPELIAQHAVEPRDHARLLVLHRADGRREHRHFHDLVEYLHADDLLVLNDTRVVPARLFACRATGGRVELLLVRPAPGGGGAAGTGAWEAIVGGGKGVRPGEELAIAGTAAAHATMLRKERPGRWTVDFGGTDVRALLAAAGKAPLPPYIRRPKGEDPERAADLRRYQTVYARSEGAIAAPTAGLHFTPELLERLRAAGVETACITLHVGAGTFAPITADAVEDHRLEPEEFAVAAAAWTAIERARGAGRRVVAVGTTVTRVLETLARAPAAGGPVPGCGPETVVARADGGAGWSGRSALFIHPPFDFRIVGPLVTNFHLPDGTPLLLAAARAGRDHLLAAYDEAIRARYRFFSYGDAMLIV